MEILRTSIDQLVDFVVARHGCTVEEASRALSLPYRKVEQMADTLAESGLIEVRYGFRGTRLTPKNKLAKALPIPEETVVREVPGRLALQRIDAIGEELAQALKLIAFSEQEIKKKINRATTHFEQLQEEEVHLGSIKESIAKLRSAELSLRALEEKTDSLDRAASEIRGHLGGLEGMLEIRAMNGERKSRTKNARRLVSVS